MADRGRRRTLALALAWVMGAGTAASLALGATAGPPVAGPPPPLPPGCQHSLPAAGDLPSCRAALRGPANAGSFDDVVFADPRHGWRTRDRCGPAGPVCATSIEATTAGGARWTPGYGGPLAVGRLVAADAGDAYAVGQLPGCPDTGSCAPRVMATSGQSAWTVRAVLPAGQVTGLVFDGASTGWVAENACTSTLDCVGTVLATTDGGTSWAAVGSWPTAVIGIAMVDGSPWVAQPAPAPPGQYWPGVQLVRAGAGGAWIPVGVAGQGTLPADAQAQVSLAESSPQDIVLSFFDQDSCAIHGCQSAVLRSAAGGAQWGRPDGFGAGGCGPVSPLTVSVPPGGPAYVAADADGNCPDMDTTVLSAAGPTEAWRPVRRWLQNGVSAMSWPAPGDGWLVAAGALVHVVGAVWQQVDPSPTPTTGLVQGPGQVMWGTGTAWDDGAVLVSRDEGRHWRVTATLPGLTAFPNLVDGKVLVADRAEIALSLVQSGDGARWRPVGDPSGPLRSASWAPAGAGFGLQGLRFFGRRGVLLVSGPYDVAIEYSADGGRHWGAVRRLAPLATVWASDFSTPGHGVLAAETGTSNRTLAWTLTGGHLRSAHLPRTSPGAPVAFQVAGRSEWVLGQDLVISPDGGAHWQVIDLPAPLQAYDGVPNLDTSPLVLTSPSAAWLMTVDGLWRTTDGGGTWTLRAA